MNRIAQTFQELRKAGRKGLIGYLTAGDPNPDVSEENVRIAVGNGLDVLELGIPFSDPTADGPTIQEAAQRALAGGMTVKKALRMVSSLRRDVTLPIVLFGYANPFFRYGYDRFCAEAAEAGADGLLVVDMPFEQTDELRGAVDRRDLCLIPLIAPTTPRTRSELILRDARGFVYYISVTGVTGARQAVPTGIAEHVALLRQCTALPVAVGFGIGSGKQARQVAEAADAVVVGSALVRAAREGVLAKLVGELRGALDE